MTTSAGKTGGATRRGVMAAGAGLAIAGAGRGAALAQTMEIIDTHAHIRSPDFQRYPPLPAVAARPQQGRGQTVEQLIAEMDAAGVSKAACVQLSSFYGPDDAYLADSVPKYPGRLTGVCSVNVLAPDAVKTLEGWLARPGITGLRIFTGGGEDSDTALLDDPRAYPVWALCERRGVPVVAQTTPEGLPKVRALRQRFPRAVIVLDHGAHPTLDQGPPYAQAQSLFDMAALPNLYVKVTPPLWALASKGKATPQSFCEALVKAFGANRLAFGSNLPMTAGPMSKIVAQAMDATSTLSPADRAMIFAGTAKHIYKALA